VHFQSHQLPYPASSWVRKKISCAEFFVLIFERVRALPPSEMQVPEIVRVLCNTYNPDQVARKGSEEALKKVVCPRVRAVFASFYSHPPALKTTAGKGCWLSSDAAEDNHDGSS